MKKKAGRPVKFAYNGDTAETVRTLAEFGVPYEDIAAKFGMSSDTLVKLYSDELSRGKAEAHEKARQALFEEAVINRDKTLLMFYCKTQLGMKETNDLNINATVDLSASDILVKAKNRVKKAKDNETD